MSAQNEIISEDIMSMIFDTVDIEIQGLKIMQNSLDRNLIDAIKIILNTKGKIITGGVGKSGHIAAKFSATLSSIGISSFFMHSTEASHGDLGAIGIDDTILLLSNSGNTAELSDMVYYAKRFGIPVISMTSNPDSMLSKNSDIAILLPDAQEASEIDAPTTSSTMMMVLGDAIAVTLQKITNFSASDYSIVHPGGKLGAKLKTVRDVMHLKDDVPKVLFNTPIDDVLQEITSKSLGCSCVVDNNNYIVGMVTDGDIRRHFHIDSKGKVAVDIMSKSPKTISPCTFVSTALKTMEDHKITSLVVTNDDKQVIGLLHLHDCIRIGLV